MRKLAGGLGAVVVAVLIASAADAHASPSAATVLSNVQQLYAHANQLSAVFQQTVTNATFNKSTTSNGELWIVKPADMRWDYIAKHDGNAIVEKSFIFDGATLWLVDHENKEITQKQVQASAVPAAVSFLTGGTALSSQFSVALDTSGTYGGQGAIVLRLTPNQRSAQYKQLFFVVDPSDWRVKESIVIDSSGNTNAFRFYAPNTTTAIPPSSFTVNPASLPTYKFTKLRP